MSAPIPEHLRATYGRCACGARITQYNASACIICTAAERRIEALIARRRFALAMTLHFGHPLCFGRRAPRYMDGKEVVEG
jgi:hypothetical protein